MECPANTSLQHSRKLEVQEYSGRSEEPNLCIQRNGISETYKYKKIQMQYETPI